MLFTSVLVLLTLTQPSIIIAKSLKTDNEENNYEENNQLLYRQKRQVGIEPSITLDTDTLVNLLIIVILAMPQTPKFPASVYRLILNPFRLKAAMDLKGGVVLSKRLQLEFPVAVGARIGALGLMGGVAVGARPSIGLNGVKMSAGVVGGFGSRFASGGVVANGDTASIQKK